MSTGTMQRVVVKLVNVLSTASHQRAKVGDGRVCMDFHGDVAVTGVVPRESRSERKFVEDDPPPKPSRRGRVGARGQHAIAGL